MTTDFDGLLRIVWRLKLDRGSIMSSPNNGIMLDLFGWNMNFWSKWYTSLKL